MHEEEGDDNEDESDLNREEEEDEEDEYDTQNEDEDQDCDDEEAEEAEAEDLMDERRNDLERIIRDAQIDNARIRAKTAPLCPMEHVEQFKMTPNFTNLEQAAVCAVQINQRNNDSKFDLDTYEG